MSSLDILFSGLFKSSLTKAIYINWGNEGAYKLHATAESCQHLRLELWRGIPEIHDDVIRLPTLRKINCDEASTSWNVYFSMAYLCEPDRLFHLTCHRTVFFI